MAAPEFVVNMQDKLAQITGRWSPAVVAEANDWHVKLVKVTGEFVWHAHDVDELFLVLVGELVIELEHRPPAHLTAGELFVVPRAVRHRPSATSECQLMLLEPSGVLNTGDVQTRRTATEQWL